MRNIHDFENLMQWLATRSMLAKGAAMGYITLFALLIYGLAVCVRLEPPSTAQTNTAAARVGVLRTDTDAVTDITAERQSRYRAPFLRAQSDMLWPSDSSRPATMPGALNIQSYSANTD